MQLKINNLFRKIEKEKYDKYFELVPNFKQEKTQKFTTVILTLIAFATLLIFAINPTLSTIANLQKQLDDAKFIKEKLDQKINDLSVLQTKYNNIQPDLPIVYNAIPKTSQVPQFTGQLQTLIKESNLSIVALQASDIPTSQIDNFSSYTFDISTRGDYQAILNFLEELISMQRVISLSNVSIDKQSENNINVLQVNVKGYALFKF